MQQRFTASVVGAGTGGRLSLKALTASDRFDLVAAADLRADVRRTLEHDFPGLRTFASHDEMLRACPTDIVCVSTYPPSHEEVTADALAALPELKGLLVEKPLGHTAASGRRIVDAIRARRLPLAVPHGLLAKRTPLEVIERVHGGAIGGLKLVEIQCRGWDIINAGIHWLDFFVTLTAGDPVEHVFAAVDASTRTFRDGMQVETVAVTTAQTRSGVRVMQHTGDADRVRVNADGYDTAFRLVGTGGVIEFYGWAAPYRLLNAEHPVGETITPPEMPVTGHRYHLQRLADQIDAGTPDYAIADGSLAALEVCEAAYLSAQHRCVVPFPLADFAPPAVPDWQPGQPYSGDGSGGRDGRQPPAGA
jgi:predicted dehydrogenase